MLTRGELPDCLHNMFSTVNEAVDFLTTRWQYIFTCFVMLCSSRLLPEGSAHASPFAVFVTLLLLSFFDLGYSCLFSVLVLLVWSPLVFSFLVVITVFPVSISFLCWEKLLIPKA